MRNEKLGKLLYSYVYSIVYKFQNRFNNNHPKRLKKKKYAIFLFFLLSLRDVVSYFFLYIQDILKVRRRGFFVLLTLGFIFELGKDALTSYKLRLD